MLLMTNTSTDCTFCMTLTFYSMPSISKISEYTSSIIYFSATTWGSRHRLSNMAVIFFIVFSTFEFIWTNMMWCMKLPIFVGLNHSVSRIASQCKMFLMWKFTVYFLIPVCLTRVFWVAVIILISFTMRNIVLVYSIGSLHIYTAFLTNML